MALNELAGFGELLRRNRLAAGLTQEGLAELAGMSSRGIADLERGARRWPYPATVRRLAKGLGLGKADRAAFQTAARPAPPVAGPSHQEVIDAAPVKRHNLPNLRTNLIGRDHDRAVVRQTLLQGGQRLVTLTGTGGCGKTRLALAVGAGIDEIFADGVWLVELGSLDDPALLPHSVAKALGVREDPSRDILETLLLSLKARQLLLLLDNCEHLIEACAVFVDRLLADCPGVRLLATSREPLRIPGETTWPVPSLDVPDQQQNQSLDEVARSPAVQLFVERAQAVQPAFVLTAQNVSSIARICRRLGGLPLAIELGFGEAGLGVDLADVGGVGGGLLGGGELAQGVVDTLGRGDAAAVDGGGDVLADVPVGRALIPVAAADGRGENEPADGQRQNRGSLRGALHGGIS
jgi:transcriptional regulator with XRE-family HTH domain